MLYCDCGAPIPRRKQKGGREREYCSHACQQRAYRQRHKGEHDIERARREAEARIWTKIEQDIHRETWQDELESSKNLIKSLLVEAGELSMVIESLENEIAKKNAEIIRLNALLDWHSKKKKP